ncbi:MULTISPECIES: sulfotransferase [Methylobacterium]|uniref:sulfotransferase n=1 Tax=Methylobacterium TaxID=407 RepID=UPI001FED6EFA|nr:sulfotransferase [Methylobacterium sp. DB0501]
MSLLEGWTPFRAGWVDGAMTVDWCHLGEHRLTDPFFYETIARAIGYPFNLAFRQRTLADDLGALSPGLTPSGFVFHMARCGSTLAAQALGADPRHIVASEPGPVRAVLEAPRHAAVAPERADAWLAGIVHALGRPRFPGEEKFFVKFMAADILELPWIQRVFPGVPWVFLYRDPVEILASQMRRGGADTAPGSIPPERLGLPRETVFAMDRKAYQLTAMAAYGQAALDGLARAPGRGRVLRYDDLPDGLWPVFATHFGLDPALPGFSAMRAASGRHAKTGAAFVPDGAEKREAAAAWRPAAERIAGPVLSALDAARERAWPG